MQSKVSGNLFELVAILALRFADKQISLVFR
jgi:hypothetical protein